MTVPYSVRSACNDDQDCIFERGLKGLDGDGFPAWHDCNDSDAGMCPGALHIPNDGVGQDCDGRDLRVNFRTDALVRVTLTWADVSDLDLSVTDPGGECVSYESRRMSSGG